MVRRHRARCPHTHRHTGRHRQGDWRRARGRSCRYFHILHHLGHSTCALSDTSLVSLDTSPSHSLTTPTRFTHFSPLANGPFVYQHSYSSLDLPPLAYSSAQPSRRSEAKRPSRRVCGLHDDRCIYSTIPGIAYPVETSPPVHVQYPAATL